MKTRTEKDSLGTKPVPSNVYYGIETLRALENFPITGLHFHPYFFQAIAAVKKSCAIVNGALGRLPQKKVRVISRACDEILAGRLSEYFVTDVLQAGAGVSAHMNANEIIANRGLELLGKKKGQYEFLDPHDDVNMGQSTNDVIPTAIRVAALRLMNDFMKPAENLEKAFSKKASEFKRVIKSGRTHLQDAAPITLGQEFSGWGRQLEKGRKRILGISGNLLEVGLGGSAVGTGLNTTLSYRKKVIRELRKITGIPVRNAANFFEVMQSDADIAALSGGLRDYALSLIQISHDLRLLSSGPKTGFGEISLPARQPGSSIMPGKVNPVMPEAASQVAFQVIGYDAAIAYAVSSGQLELNVMRSVIAYNLLQSLHILKNVTDLLRRYCIEGITADISRCRFYAESSFGIAAALNPHIGYRKAAECVKEAARTGKTLRQVVQEKGYLNSSEIRLILSPAHLTQPKK